MWMKFIINKNSWTIKTLPSKQLLEIYKNTFREDEEPTFCYGVTVYPLQEIYINSEMETEQQIKTLKHELTHCYIWNNALYNVPNFNEEMVCDLVACSNEFINEIVELFIKRKNEQKIEE